MFYTSRYAYLASRFLRHLSRKRVDLDGYHAERLEPVQREALAKLLRHPPSAFEAESLIAFVKRVNRVKRGSPQPSPACNAQLRHVVDVHKVIRREQNPGHPDIPPTDPIHHLGRLYGFRVTVRGNTVWLEIEPCLRLAETGSQVIRNNILESLRLVSRHGYLVMNHHPASDDESMPG